MLTMVNIESMMNLDVLRALYRASGQSETADLLDDFFTEKSAPARPEARLLTFRLYDGRVVNQMWNP